MKSRTARPHLWAAALLIGAAGAAYAHGDVTPQAVDTKGLPELGETWRAENPYRKNEAAVKIGSSAFNQNCARCHGLGAVSGGIAPDLRFLEAGDTGDEWFIQRYQHGSSHDGKVYMPPFGDVLGQEAGWAIRSWLDTVHEE